MPHVKGLILADQLPRDELTAIAGAAAPHALRIGNQPLVSYALRAIRNAGIQDVGIVVCERSRPHVEAALRGDASGDMPRRVWIESSLPLDFAQSLDAAADFLGRDPFVVHSGDAILLHPLDAFLTELLTTEPDALLLTRAHTTPERPRQLSDAEPHPAARGGVLAGAHFFGPRVLEVAAAAEAGSGPAELAATLSRAGGKVLMRAVEGSWTYQGSVDQALEANRMVLDELRRERFVHRSDDVRIEGRVSVHPSATLENTTVRGPAVIGRGAMLRDSFVGPYSAIGESVTIDAAEIEHSIVLAGATIRRPGKRLESSLIGEGAAVTRDFDLSSSLRVRVGRQTEVRLI